MTRAHLPLLSAAAGLLAAWFGLSLVVNLPPFADALLGPFHLGFALEVGAVFAVLALARRRGGAAPAPLVHGLAMLLTLLAALRLADFLARSVVSRSLDLALDVSLLPATLDVAQTLLGPWLALAAVAGVLAGLFVLYLAIVRTLRAVAGLLASRSTQGLMLGLGVMALAVYGGQRLFLDDQPAWRPVAASASLVVRNQLTGVAEALARREAFLADLVGDPADDIPDAALFEALGDRDVLLVFIESYGVTALDEPRYAEVVGPRLAAFEEAASAAGFALSSGRLVAASAGGQSWLNHASLTSGRFIDDQTLYSLFLTEQPRTLVEDFARAGRRTVQLMPAITMPWPEGVRLGYEATYEARDMDYDGPHFYWGIVPDQFALDVLARRELDGPRARPVFAMAALISSHAPWLPVPDVVPWEELGDGSVYRRWTDGAPEPREVWRDRDAVRTQYALSIAHSIDAVSAFVAERLDPETVVIVMGDHQPAPLITGDGASRAAPVHVLANDPALLAPLRALGFGDGVLPPPVPIGDDAALPRMDALRAVLLDGWSRVARAEAVDGAIDGAIDE